MKQICSIIILAFILFSCDSPESNSTSSSTDEVKDSLILAGSETVKPLIEDILNSFLSQHSEYSGRYVQSGTPKGIALLAEKKCDITFASRDLKPAEDTMLREKGEIVSTLLAYEGISVIINSKNKINKITAEQIRQIFSGKITNWKSIGGDNMPIAVITRDTLSGTRKFFNDKIYGDPSFSTVGEQVAIKDHMIKKVEETPGAIGYISGTISTLAIKTLKIDFGNWAFSGIDAQSIKTGKYPLSRPFYCIYYKSHRKVVHEFLNYLQSQESMEKIFAEGFIPLSSN